MTTIGIDLGGTRALGVRIDAGEIVDSQRFDFGRTIGTLDAIHSAIESVADGSEHAIGVGVAGLVRPHEGELVWGPHLPGTHVPIAQSVADRYGLPVVVDNDANTALHAEMHSGVARGYNDVLLVTLGTGIGGAIAIDGKIYRGQGFAGEWGHVRIEGEGLLCDCGRRGCWETRASGPALARLAREVVTANPDSSLARVLNGSSLTGEGVVAAADAGDETARALVIEVGRSLGQGLADLSAIFDPELIVVGGGLGSVGESIVGPARRVLADSLHGGNLRVPPTVQVAKLGPTAGAFGAALLAHGS
ncbi:MAG: ROK family protein [Acidimicrobiia bacterium]